MLKAGRSPWSVYGSRGTPEKIPWLEDESRPGRPAPRDRRDLGRARGGRGRGHGAVRRARGPGGRPADRRLQGSAGEPSAEPPSSAPANAVTRCSGSALGLESSGSAAVRTLDHEISGSGSNLDRKVPETALDRRLSQKRYVGKAASTFVIATSDSV